MIRYFVLALLMIPVLTGCNGAAIDRLKGEDATPTPTPTPTADQTGAQNNVDTPQSPANVGVNVNGYSLSAEDLEALYAAFGLTIADGSYWYDPVSGAWGLWGGPTSGFIVPTLDLGYAPVNASGGSTGVVLNGRELHPQDLVGLEQLLGPIQPGFYWLDANGYYGIAGGPAVGNLIFVAQNAAGGGGYYANTYFGNIGGDGQTSYFYDSETGCSVISGGGVSC